MFLRVFSVIIINNLTYLMYDRIRIKYSETFTIVNISYTCIDANKFSYIYNIFGLQTSFLDFHFFFNI